MFPYGNNSFGDAAFVRFTNASLIRHAHDLGLKVVPGP